MSCKIKDDIHRFKKLEKFPNFLNLWQKKEK